MQLRWVGLLHVIAASAAIPTVSLNGIGRKTIEMPLVGLGTWRLGNQTVESVATALKLGYRHLDCALGYGNQKLVGEALAKSGIPRADVWVTTKIPGGLNTSVTLQSAEQSVQELGLEYVDLMLIHYPASWSKVGGPELRKEEWTALERWAERGRARSLGVSHYCKRHLSDILSVATQPVALNQVQYHVGMGAQSGLNASLRHDPDFMRAHGVVYAAYSTLCGPCPSPDNRLLINGPLVSSIGKAHGVSGAQVALKWAVQQGIPVVPRSTNPKHLQSNLDLFGFNLSAAEMEMLSTANRPVETGTPPQPPDDAQDCLVP